MKTIAVIDDDIYIGNMLEELLKKENYKVIRAYSGTEALYMLRDTRPDLVILDLMMPGLSGEEVLPEIKDIPIIIMSAKSSVDDKVNMLLGGASDYITKPFDTKELLARITVQLRKREHNKLSNKITAGKLKLDKNINTVFCGSYKTRLTKTEAAILGILMQNSDNIISKSAILEATSYETPDCTEDSLKQHISNIRNKIKKLSNKDMIEAVWGIGYIFHS